MKLSTFFSRELIGLDVQSRSLQLVKLKKKRNGFWLEQAIKKPLAEEIFFEEKNTSWEKLSFQLAELVHELSIKNLPVALTLPANLVRMQHICLPLGLTEKEIEAEISQQIQRDLPGMNDALCIDFIATPAKTPHYADIFFAAARQEYLAQYVECVNAAGLKVKLVDIDIYALQRAINFMLPFSPSKNKINALIHVANHKAAFMVFTADKMIFHQQWDFIEKTDFLTQLNNNLQIYTVTSNHLINKLMICTSEYEEEVTGSLRYLNALTITYLCHFSKVKIKTELAEVITPLSLPNFLIACGAAMRELPPW